MDPSKWRSPLTRGMQGQDVLAWQLKLLRRKYIQLADGIFGRMTEKATMAFQVAHGLRPDGIVGPKTRSKIDEDESPKTLPDGIFDRRWQFLQATNYGRIIGIRKVSLIVMHTMQHPRRPDTAEAVAAWFAGAIGKAPEASAHVCGDEDSIVQCVKPNDVAWGAKGGNSIGYHCEQAGYAEWKRETWLEEENRAALRLMASHVRMALEHFILPAVALSTEEVAACVRDALIANGKVRGRPSGVRGGITEHRKLTEVWRDWKLHGLTNPRSDPKPWWPDHYDCGSGYPMDVLLSDIKDSGTRPLV